MLVGHPYEGIDGVYVASATDPIANGWPHFEHKSGTWHLYRGADSIWRVSSNFLPDQTNSFCYAPASEDGLVPVGTSTWQVCPDGQTYVAGDLTVTYENVKPAFKLEFSTDLTDQGKVTNRASDKQPTQQPANREPLTQDKASCCVVL